MKEARDELVRIDSRGEAHPIGVVASQRMRARAGAYRMLPAPDHVVFMRFTGEDGRRDADDGAIVRLAGEVTSPGAMCDVLAMVAQAGWRGELVALTEDDARSIFFEQGFVVGAFTNVENERLGTVLYRYGAITQEQLTALLERIASGQRIGEAAVEIGVVTQEQVYEYMRRQVEEVVFATLTISDGTFYFLDGFDDGRLGTRHAIPAHVILMDGVTRLDEMRYFREKIPSADFVPVRVDGATDPPEECAPVFRAVDGKLSIEELGRVTGEGEFATTKHIYQLIQSKMVRVDPPRVTGGPEAIVTMANTALRAIFLTIEAAEKAAPVRENLASFAVGAGVYDILFRNAGPSSQGTLDARVVMDNLVIVAGGGDPENILRQMLHEYVSFALFSAGAALGSEKEAELGREVAPVLAQLRPKA
ncbi:MAG: DUF4388 domain-containing protein [Polyangiaceae bacterium]|nr:DUF4388 domain-containing protein [Polyangiaceae bacterium]